MGYPSDLRGKDWELIAHHFSVGSYGNRSVHSRRSLINGILYVVKTGCQWRMLPKDFPPWKTVYGYFRRLSKLAIWENVLADIVLKKQKKVKKMLADLGYRGFFEEVVTKVHKRKVEFSSKIVGQFALQPKRWIVERTIAWLNWARRLSKDFEQKCIYSENIIRLSAIALILRQIH